MTKTLHQGRPILGYTDTETVKLDFDDTALNNVKYWAKRTTKWFNFGGFLILKSSKKSYHVVFNRSVSWVENLKIVAWVALGSQNRGLIKWLIMQCIKQSSTLRVSNKLQKKSPRVVVRFGKQNNQIKNYLEYRKIIKSISKKLIQTHKL